MSPGAVARLAGPPLAVAVVWVVLAVVPTVLDSGEDDLAALSDERDLVASELTEARSAPVESDDLDRRIATASAAVPETAELAAFIRAVGDVGDLSGVDVEQIAPLTVNSDTDPDPLIVLPEGTSSITISVGASGSYDQVMTFAAELAELDRLVVIDLVGLTADEEDSSSVILDLELRIFTTEELVVVPEVDDPPLDESDGEGVVEDGGVIEDGSDDGPGSAGLSDAVDVTDAVDVGLGATRSGGGS